MPGHKHGPGPGPREPTKKSDHAGGIAASTRLSSANDGGVSKVGLGQGRVSVEVDGHGGGIGSGKGKGVGGGGGGRADVRASEGSMQVLCGNHSIVVITSPKFFTSRRARPSKPAAADRSDSERSEWRITGFDDGDENNDGHDPGPEHPGGSKDTHDDTHDSRNKDKDKKKKKKDKKDKKDKEQDTGTMPDSPVTKDQGTMTCSSSTGTTGSTPPHDTLDSGSLGTLDERTCRTRFRSHPPGLVGRTLLDVARS